MITFLSGGSLVLIENFWYSIPSMYWVWGCEILSTYDVRVMSFTSKRSIHPGIICSASSYFSMLNLKLLNEVQPVDRVNFLALVTISICSPLLANKEASYGLRVQLIIYVRSTRLRPNPGIPARREHIEKHGRRNGRIREGTGKSKIPRKLVGSLAKRDAGSFINSLRPFPQNSGKYGKVGGD